MAPIYFSAEAKAYAEKGQEEFEREAMQFLNGHADRPVPPAAAPITERQLSLAQKLLRQKYTPEKFQHVVEEDLKHLSKRDASDFISEMVRQPKVENNAFKAVHRPEVPEGYYLLNLPGAKAHYVFWAKVKQDEGITRVYRISGAPGALASKPIQRIGLIHKVLETIMVNPDAAAALFAATLGHCYRCGSPLTDAESRAIGLGPICRNK